MEFYVVPEGDVFGEKGYVCRDETDAFHTGTFEFHKDASLVDAVVQEGRWISEKDIPSDIPWTIRAYDALEDAKSEEQVLKEERGELQSSSSAQRKMSASDEIRKRVVGLAF